MSNDLISRKALLKGFYEHTNGGTQRYLIPEEIWEMVELAPTAYDIDKVVEQLADASCYVEDGDGHAGHFVFTEEAIEIVVKGGGSDD